jgi:hypothetical protein
VFSPGAIVHQVEQVLWIFLVAASGDEAGQGNDSDQEKNGYPFHEPTLAFLRLCAPHRRIPF